MKQIYFQVDAFSNEVFGGNPAGVCPLVTELPDSTMQQIAQENNLAETAFFIGKNGHYSLRWFTPTVEVDLCGHATLATAHIIFSKLEPTLEIIQFETRSGRLTVAKEGTYLVMNFPEDIPKPIALDESLGQALGIKPVALFRGISDLMAVFETQQEIETLTPDMAKIATHDARGVIATAPGNTYDVVSRFFAPQSGVPEDPVTGSAHCTLAPYWGKRLDKKELRAFQCSARGGEVLCTWQSNGRVLLKGQAVTYLEGHIFI